MKKRKGSGIQLHITSLPSKFGIGDFGPEAYKFADFLAQSSQTYWQVLPLNQVRPEDNFSPYSCLSAFAGNCLLISPELLYKEGLLAKSDILDIPAFNAGKVNFQRVYSYKNRLFDKAFENFRPDSDYDKFCGENKGWLEDWAVFSASKSKKDINRGKFLQYIFLKQWLAIKNYCNKKGIKIIGDIPFYVTLNSADVWAFPEIFKLTKNKKPLFISGVPPDYYSRTGQLWNNPVYDWKMLKKTRYKWWIERIKHNLQMFDYLRLDHFRGFFAFWQVKANSKTAKNGRWVKGPGEDFLKELFRHFSKSRFIAEDLGYITKDVRDAIKKSDLTCMKVMLFAFGSDNDARLHWPGNYPENSIVYIGTHDSNTAIGWFKNEADASMKEKLFKLISRQVPVSQIPWELISIAEKTASDKVIVQMQDILGLDEKSRMNLPATSKGNWKWRLEKGKITKAIINKLKNMTKSAGRSCSCPGRSNF